MTFLEAIQKASVNANEAGKPMALMRGTVTSAAPLKIQIDQRLELDADLLILTSSVMDYETEITVSWETAEKSGGSGDASFASHKHSVAGKKKIKVHNALKVGETVLLLRVQGGQKFIVLDRVKGA